MANAGMSQAERWKIIDDGIERKKMIADGHPVRPFTTQDNMMIYDCVYNLSQGKPYDNTNKLYLKYCKAIKQRIIETVLPTLENKHGTKLLIDFTKLWSELKAFAQSLSKLFMYLEQYHICRKPLLPLLDIPKHFFRDMVCEELFGKVQEAILKSINQEREGKKIDRNLLKSVFDLFMELEDDKKCSYFEKFEKTMLDETIEYYSQLSMEWWFWRDSYTNYLRKVDWCMYLEVERAEIYPSEKTAKRIIEAMRYALIEQCIRMLSALPRAQTDFTESEQALIAKYNRLDLGPEDFTTCPDVSNGIHKASTDSSSNPVQ